MSNIKEEAEVIQLSIYCDIIMAIMKKNETLSINKLITFAYLIKKNNYYDQDVFRGNNTKGVVIKAISLLNGLRDDFFSSIIYAFTAIDLLIGAGKIKAIEDRIVLCDKEFKSSFVIGLFFEKAIESSNLFTDRQFLKEVLSNV